MKFGAMNDPSKNPVEEARLIGEMGFDYIDLTVEGPEAPPEIVAERMGELKDTLSSYGLEIVGHTSWFLQLAHPYDSVRRAYLNEALKALKVLAEVGAAKVAYHPITMVSSVYRRKPYRDRLLRLMISSLKALSSEASELGVKVMIENLDGGRIWSIDEYRIMLEESGAYFHLDVGHANLNAEEVMIERFLQNFPPGFRLIHVHISDNMGGSALKGWDLHLPLGVGRIDWSRVFKLLRGYGYNDTVTLEVFSKDRDYLRLSLMKAREFSLSP